MANKAYFITYFIYEAYTIAQDKALATCALSCHENGLFSHTYSPPTWREFVSPEHIFFKEAHFGKACVLTSLTH